VEHSISFVLGEVRVFNRTGAINPSISEPDVDRVLRHIVGDRGQANLSMSENLDRLSRRFDEDVLACLRLKAAINIAAAKAATRPLPEEVRLSRRKPA